MELLHENTCLLIPLYDCKNIWKSKQSIKKPHEKEPTKKRPHVNGITIFNFFDAKDSYKKMCRKDNF